MNASFEKLDEHTCVHLKFNFMKEYKRRLLELIFMSVAFFIIILIGQYLTFGYIDVLSKTAVLFYTIAVVLVLIFGAFLLFGTFLNIHSTKRTFRDGLEDFAYRYVHRKQNSKSTEI